MSLWRYLASNAVGLTIGSLTVLLCGFMLVVAGVESSIATLVCLVMACGAVLVIALQFLRRRAFYRTLQSATESSEHALWIAEMIDRPDFLEGEITYEALHAISKAMHDEIASHRRQVRDYRDYIETWVHEAKSPLAAARLILENMPETALADAGSAEAILDKTEALGEELDRVERYIEQALFYARSETLDRDYLIRRYVLKDLVGAAIKANARALISAHIAPVRSGLDLAVFTDEKWMGFILGQIIQNSVKYACDASPIIEFSGRLLHEGKSDEMVELRIRDNGCGVAASDLPRVFDKGFTGENGRIKKRSTGIGLYLVKRLCDKMDVGITAESCEGAGFTVTLTFSTNKMHYFE